MNHSKLLGGILLIVGTSIGGGMLALPVSTAQMGFSHSLFFLFFCWFIMTAGAFFILEVNLRLPAGSNMVSMAKATLGLPGQIIAWISYLLLLYALLSGYISGGNDVLTALLQRINIHLPSWLTTISFTMLFACIVYKGIRSVDYVNRTLMFGKLGVYFILISLIMPHVSTTNLLIGSHQGITGALMILISSFGFASIVPSLRDYFKDEVHLLRRAILVGSLFPLLCYIAWEAVIMGVIAREGSEGLLALSHSSHATSGLMVALSGAVNSQWIGGFFSFFTSICMATAFLGVSLGLFDFFSDGLKLKKSGRQGHWTLLLTFLPPLIIVLINPGIYLHAMSYAGICCVILLLLLPTLMAWQGRKQDPNNAKETHRVPGGNLFLAIVGMIAVILLFIAIFE